MSAIAKRAKISASGKKPAKKKSLPIAPVLTYDQEAEDTLAPTSPATSAQDDLLAMSDGMTKMNLVGDDHEVPVLPVRTGGRL